MDALAAMTAVADAQSLETNDAATIRSSMMICGKIPEVTQGRYLTSGGHSLISSHYGLAADNSLDSESWRHRHFDLVH